jgi:hypothetical protein
MEVRFLVSERKRVATVPSPSPLCIYWKYFTSHGGAFRYRCFSWLSELREGMVLPKQV